MGKPRKTVDVADLVVPAIAVAASAEIRHGITQNQIIALGKPKLGKPARRAGRALRAEGRSYAICSSHTLPELALLDRIADHHNTTRSEAIRVAVRFYISHLEKR